MTLPVATEHTHAVRFVIMTMLEPLYTNHAYQCDGNNSLEMRLTVLS